MTHETSRVEQVFEAMRRQGRSAKKLPPTEFEVVEALMHRKRRRARLKRRLVTTVSVLAAAALGVVVVRAASRDPAAGGSPAASSAAPVARPQPANPPAGTLARLEPSPDLIVYADETARLELPDPDRILLAAGTISLELRRTDPPRRLVVQTPTAEVVVNGTVLAVTAGANGTAVDVLRGSVDVVLAGTTVTVAQAQRLPAGALRPEPLPPRNAARLAELFPDEAPAVRVAQAPPAPVEPPVGPTVEPNPASAQRESPPANPPPRPANDAPNADDVYRRVEDALQAGRLAEAAGLLREVLALASPGSGREGTALVDLAGVCDRLGDTACRRDALQRYLDRHPSGALREDARIDLCRLLETSGATEPLDSCLRSYLAEYPQGRMASWARGLLGARATRGGTPHRADE